MCSVFSPLLEAFRNKKSSRARYSFRNIFTYRDENENFAKKVYKTAHYIEPFLTITDSLLINGMYGTCSDLRYINSENGD